MTVGDIGWLGAAPRFDGTAACSETDPEAFFPDQNQSAREAKRICGMCEVKDECLEWALGYAEHGVWGGLSERERGRIRGRRKAAS